jgi:hypothetical protein
MTNAAKSLVAALNPHTKKEAAATKEEFLGTQGCIF